MLMVVVLYTCGEDPLPEDLIGRRLYRILNAAPNARIQVVDKTRYKQTEILRIPLKQVI